MSEHLEHEAIRAKHVKVMGEPLGTLYTDLLGDIVWLQADWHQYRVLFGTSDARVELENWAAGFFFGILQDTLWHSVLLHISRLTDPPRPGRRDKATLTLRILPNELQDPQLKQEVHSLIKQATDASAFARDWRDRRIAHRDQSTKAKPLEDASRADVEAVLAVISKIVNAIEKHYFGSETMLFNYVSPPNDAEALLRQLSLARMIQDERDARLKAGDSRPEDRKQPPKI